MDTMSVPTIRVTARNGSPARHERRYVLYRPLVVLEGLRSGYRSASDRPWGPERPIFGVVRYMSSENTARKMSVEGYLSRFAPEGAKPPARINFAL
jgi:hypothetical protein